MLARTWLGERARPADAFEQVRAPGEIGGGARRQACAQRSLIYAHVSFSGRHHSTWRRRTCAPAAEKLARVRSRIQSSQNGVMIFRFPRAQLPIPARPDSDQLPWVSTQPQPDGRAREEQVGRADAAHLREDRRGGASLVVIW